MIINFIVTVLLTVPGEGSLPECTQGMTPVKVHGRPLKCQRGKYVTCPNGAICLQNPVTLQSHCCVPDPSEGCAVGSRVVRTSADTALLCKPVTSSKLDTCPSHASCQWNFSAKQYQCCEPEDGCPRGHKPMLDSRLVVRTCSPDKSPSCLMSGTCWYNVWHAAFQCCQPILENLCPLNQVAFLSPKGPLSCIDNTDCPELFTCHRGICCGLPGKCPLPAQEPTRDSYGHIHACFAPGMVDCPGNSLCETARYPSLKHKWKQQLCCSKIQLQCSEGGIPYPNEQNPMKCDLLDSSSCPTGSKCQSSNYPNQFICCKTKNIANHMCPKTWTPQHKKVTFCRPGSKDCDKNSDCLLSPISQQFICCVKTERFQTSRLSQLTRESKIIRLDMEYTCPLQFVGPEVRNRQERQCFLPGVRGECSAGFVCTSSIENPNIYLCCGPGELRDDARFRCPNPGQIEVLENGQNVICDLATNSCPAGATCQSAINSFMMMICCYSSPSATPVCPTDSIPQPSAAGYVPCDNNRDSQCDTGYVCIPSINQPQTSICCSRVLPTAHICPNQQAVFLDAGRPKVCNPQQINPCPSGYVCSLSVSSTNTYICCSLPSTATCPANYAVVRDINNQPLRCSVSRPNDCPSGSQCLQSPNQPFNALCCQSSEAPRVCPNNKDALLQSNGQLERCTGPGSACSAGYTCELSPVLSQWICCGQSQARIMCADGSVPYSQLIGQPTQCNLYAFPSECPNGYRCTVSSNSAISVCCLNNVIVDPIPPDPPNPFPNPPTQNPDNSTFRPPTPDLTCPTGWSAYEDSEGAYNFCQGPTDRTCPQGFSCAQSSVSSIFLCCRLASNLACGQITQSPLLVNNAPKLCTRNLRNTCPVNFSCQTSNVAQVTICCSNSVTSTITNNNNFNNNNFNTNNNFNNNNLNINNNNNLLNNNNLNRNNQLITIPLKLSLVNQLSTCCTDGSIPAYVGDSLVQCNYIGMGDQCPPTYVCALSTQKGVNVCCHLPLKGQARMRSRKEKVLCDETTVVVTNGHGEPLHCSGEHDNCPGNSECTVNSVEDDKYCCVKPVVDNNWSAVIPLLKCDSNGDCQHGQSCKAAANAPGINICSATTALTPTLANAKCTQRQTFLYSGKWLSCTKDSDCPDGFECSDLTTTKHNICCAKESENVCPDNRVPYLEGPKPLICDPRGKNLCPSGYLCKHGVRESNYYCCSFIAFCLPGKVPEIDSQTGQAKICHLQNCSPGYSCVDSTVPGTHVCCSSSKNMALAKSSTEKQWEVDSKLWTIMEG